MTMLSKAGFVDAVHGKGGGYRLNRAPEEYSVKEILELTEGTLAPVTCLSNDAEKCEWEKNCRTLPLWKGLYDKINEYLGSYSIADLIRK